MGPDTQEMSLWIQTRIDNYSKNFHLGLLSLRLKLNIIKMQILKSRIFILESWRIKTIIANTKMQVWTWHVSCKELRRQIQENENLNLF